MLAKKCSPVDHRCEYETCRFDHYCNFAVLSITHFTLYILARVVIMCTEVPYLIFLIHRCLRTCWLPCTNFINLHHALCKYGRKWCFGVGVIAARVALTVSNPRIPALQNI